MFLNKKTIIINNTEYEIKTSVFVILNLIKKLENKDEVEQLEIMFDMLMPKEAKENLEKLSLIDQTKVITELANLVSELVGGSEAGKK